MKALKSDLARSLLADPRANVQLRAYLANRRSATAARAEGAPGDDVIEVRSGQGVVRVRPVVVPKAA